MKLVDALDSKSSGSDTVPVRFRPRAPTKRTNFDYHVKVFLLTKGCIIDREALTYMKRRVIIFPILTMVISLVACSTSTRKEYAGVKQLRNPEKLAHTVTVDELRSSEYLAFRAKMTAFSSKLSEVIAKREYKSGENFVVSPLSCELCLGLAIRSSSGNTRQELLDAMDMDYDSFNANYKIFYNSLEREIKNNMDKITSRLLLTNSIWIDDEVTLKDSGLDALKDDYYCYSYEADFNHNNKEANEAIQDFVKDKTKGLIDQNLDLSPETLFVLMNTLYLKDIWNDDGRNLDYAHSVYKFTNSDGIKSNKQLLDGYYNDGKAISNDDYSCFYTATNNGYNIYFVKANDGKNLKDVFNKDTIGYVIDSNNYVYQDDEKLEIYHTKCIFPEYDVKSDIDLRKVFMEEFDVKSIFNETCNMSNLSDDDVYCSDFKQIARLKVDKKGIEGAAVTYMAYAGAVGPGPYTNVYEDFVVDQEFGYILTYGQDIIFSGIVTNID